MAQVLTPIHTHRHVNQLFRDMIGADDKTLNAAPALWVLVPVEQQGDEQGAGTVQLRPVCEHPGDLHIVQVSQDQQHEVLDGASLTQKEVAWLRLVERGVTACGYAVPVVACEGGSGEQHKVVEQLPTLHEQLGKPLKAVWQPTSVLKRWVCEKHYTSEYSSATLDRQNSGQRGEVGGGRGKGLRNNQN